MGTEPFKHDQGFDSEVFVAVHKVTLENILMSFAFLQHLKKRDGKFSLKQLY